MTHQSNCDVRPRSSWLKTILMFRFYVFTTFLWKPKRIIINLKQHQNSQSIAYGQQILRSRHRFCAVPRRFDSIRELKTCSYKFLDSSFPFRHHVHGPNRTKSQLHAVHPPTTHMSSSLSSFHFNVFLMLQKCIKNRLGVINNKRVLFRATQKREMCNKNKQYEGGMTAHANVLVLGWIFPSGVG